MLLFPAAILSISDETDRDFMKHLYIDHAAQMFRMARALTDSRQDAEDVVCEACVALIRKISLLRTLERNVLEGYIISTVKNAAYARCTAGGNRGKKQTTARRFCRRLRMMRRRRMRGFCSNARLTRWWRSCSGCPKRIRLRFG